MYIEKQQTEMTLNGLSVGLWRGENIQEESRPDQHQLRHQQLQASGGLHPPDGFSLHQVSFLNLILFF